MSALTGPETKPPAARETSVRNATAGDTRPPGANDADELMLAAEAAEAEAEAAQARAAAARARARAAALRGAAHTSSAAPTQTAPTQTAPASEALESSPAPESSDAHPQPNHPETPGNPVATETEVGKDDEVESTVPEQPSPQRRIRLPALGSRWRTAVVAVAIAVAAAALAGSGYSLWHHHDVVEKQRSAAEFTAAARQGVVALTSLDFDHAKDDVQRVLDNSTGAFRQDFQARAADFTAVIQQSHVATEGTVNAAAVESMSGDSAVVLVAATSHVTNSAGAKQEPRAWRLSVTVTRDGDRIKMSKVEFVP